MEQLSEDDGIERETLRISAMAETLANEAALKAMALSSETQQELILLAVGNRGSGRGVPASAKPSKYLAAERIFGGIYKMILEGRFSGAALALSSFGLAPRLHGLAPESARVQIEIGVRIAKGNDRELEVIALELSPDGRLEGIYEPRGWDDAVMPDAESTAARDRDYRLPPGARFLFAKAVDDSASSIAGWSERYEKTCYELLFGFPADKDCEDGDLFQESWPEAISAEDGVIEDRAKSDLAADEPDSGDGHDAKDGQSLIVIHPGAAFRSAYSLMFGAIVPRSYVVNPFAERGRVSLLFGEPGCSKTTLTAHIALSVALGRDFGPFEVTTASRVIWVNGEETQEETGRRFRGTALSFGLEKRPAIREAANNISVWSGGGALRIAEKRGGVVVFTERGRALVAEMSSFRPGLVVVDPLANAHGLDETNNVEMGDFFTLLQDTARATNSAIVIVHHSRKGSKANDGGMDDARGAGAIAGAVRSMWRLRRAENGLVELKCVKSNNFAPPEPMYFRLVSMTLGNGDEVAAVQHAQA